MFYKILSRGKIFLKSKLSYYISNHPKSLTTPPSKELKVKITSHVLARYCQRVNGRVGYAKAREDITQKVSSYLEFFPALQDIEGVHHLHLGGTTYVVVNGNRVFTVVTCYPKRKSYY